MKKTFILLFIISICSSIGTYGEELPAFFPKMKPVEKAVYLSIATDETEAKLISRVFQGILNRDSAELFLADDSHEVTWFKYTEKPFIRPEHNITSGKNKGLRTLFRNYKDRLDKLVVCNFKENDYTWNMAIMMACVENVLPVSEALKDELVNEFGWDKEIVDIRDKWNTISEAYNWALSELMPRLNKKMVFSLGLRDDWKNFPWRLYDYAVATRSFTFWLDNHSAEGKALIKKILNTEGYTRNSFVLGYGMHGDDLNDAINPEGFGFLVGDIFPNASFYSSFPTETFTQPEPTGIVAQKEKIYVALHWSDGDNIQFNHNASYDIFNQKERGEVPVSMTLSPALMEIAPFILRYYYENATANDEFIGGPSGVQYIQETLYKPMDYDAWCEMSNPWLRHSGMYVTASSLRWPAQPYLNNGFLKTGVKGTVAWTSGAYRDAYDWFGMPIVCTGGVVANKEDLYNYLSRLSVSTDHPVFTGVYMVQAGMGNDGYAGINEVVERLNTEFPEKYVFLKASDLMETASLYFKRVHAPYKYLSVPGRIEAEDFDQGGQGIGFYDTSKNNQGGKYRTNAGEYVGIGEGASGHFVGWTAAGEWLNYTIDIKEAGSYKLNINYSSTTSKTGVTILLKDRILCTAELPKAEEYTDYSLIVDLPEGEHVLKVQFLSGGMDLDYIDFVRSEFPVQKISSDKTYKIIAKHSGKVLGLLIDDDTSGTTIVQQTFNEAHHQLWRPYLVGDAYYGIQSVSSRLFISLRGGRYIQQFPFDGTLDIGKWGLQCVGENQYCIIAKGTGQVLEVTSSSTEENASLGLGAFTGADNQLFVLEEFNGGSDIHQEKSYDLSPYPNPFTTSVNIPVNMDKPDVLSLSIFNLSGNLVYREDRTVAGGLETFCWTPEMGLPQGIYMYKIEGQSLHTNGKLFKK